MDVGNDASTVCSHWSFDLNLLVPLEDAHDLCMELRL
jgi:hypothetical protein